MLSLSKKLVHLATHIPINMYSVTMAKSTIATMTPEGKVQKIVALSFHKIISSARQTKMSREKRGTKIHFTMYFKYVLFFWDFQPRNIFAISSISNGSNPVHFRHLTSIYIKIIEMISIHRVFEAIDIMYRNTFSQFSESDVFNLVKFLICLFLHGISFPIYFLFHINKRLSRD